MPNAVAEEWAAIATLAQQPRGSSTVLGRVRLREGKLELSDAVCEQGKVARTYDVQPPQASVPTVVISKADDSHSALLLLETCTSALAQPVQSAAQCRRASQAAMAVQRWKACRASGRCGRR